MTYQPFLIANYSTGFDREVQPWLEPTDAWIDLLDSFVYRGVTNKRPGYSDFANGIKSKYCESRMVHRITNENKGVGDGTVGPYSLLTGNKPVRRGTFTITAGAQTLTDNGVGVLSGSGTGTIDYTTGAVSVTFTANVTNVTTIFFTYDYHQGFPVMGIMNFYPETNTRQMIVADTAFVNRYNPATDRLDDISPATPYTGVKTSFWSWVNFANNLDDPRLLFVNNANLIQQYDGLAVTNYNVVIDGGAVVNTCLQIFNVRDRLVLIRPTVDGAVKPKRIIIGGTGQDCDKFTTDANGAGVIDIPDDTWIYGAAFNRDDLMIFTEGGTWIMKYTNNDVTPFILERIDSSRGSKAAFSVITYLNRTMAASPKGLIMTDGYRVDRMDNNIPDYTANNIDDDNFELCFSGFVDEDRDVYLIHPAPEESTSNRILVTNFEEDNFSIYRIPLSSMGNFLNAFDLTWNDLTTELGYPTWVALEDRYKNWNSFAFTKGAVFSVGGGQNGQVWRLTETASEDNALKVRAISRIDEFTIRVTTDFNNYVAADYIFLTDVPIEATDQQGFIKTIIDNYTFDMELPTASLSAYSGDGEASRVIPFVCTTKTLNPYVEMDKKVLCGWLYLYVTVSGTHLNEPSTDGLEVGDAVPCLLDLEIFRDDFTIDPEVASAVSIRRQIDLTNLPGEVGEKKWVKIWINQTARFLQFRLRNTQAGANIQIHAMMPGFRPVGRLV